jgi:hypothetical protein
MRAAAANGHANANCKPTETFYLLGFRKPKLTSATPAPSTKRELLRP